MDSATICLRTPPPPPNIKDKKSDIALASVRKYNLSYAIRGLRAVADVTQQAAIVAVPVMEDRRFWLGWVSRVSMLVLVAE